jgi:CBS domain-containing protein
MTMKETKRPSRSDYQQALRSMDTFIDITVDDLMTLTQRAEQIAGRNAIKSFNVGQVMTRPVRTVRPDTALAEAAHIMVSERISGLPVVDNEGRLTGLITEADFLRALGVPAEQPHSSLWQTLESLFNHLAHNGELETPDDPVATHMVKNVVVVSPEQDLHDVIELMKHHRVKRLVVCDEARKVLGMITRSDLVRVFFDHCTDGKCRKP